MNQTASSVEKSTKQRRRPRPIDELPEGMLDIATVLEFMPVSRSTFLKNVKAGTYPQPVHLTKRKVFWRSHEIRALLLTGPKKRSS